MWRSPPPRAARKPGSIISASIITGLAMVPIKKAFVRTRTMYSRFMMTHIFFIRYLPPDFRRLFAARFSRDALYEYFIKRRLDQLEPVHARARRQRPLQHFL